MRRSEYAAHEYSKVQNAMQRTSTRAGCEWSARVRPIDQIRRVPRPSRPARGAAQWARRPRDGPGRACVPAGS